MAPSRGSRSRRDLRRLGSRARLNDENGILKREKDVRQAALLGKALILTRRYSDLADVYAEAWDRGPAWQTAINRGLSYLTASDADAFRAGVMSGLKDLRLEPARYGLETAAEPSP